MYQSTKAKNANTNKGSDPVKSKLPNNICAALKSRAPAPGSNMIQRSVDQKGGQAQKKKTSNAPASVNLPADVKGKMENSFGADFSGVKIHTNDKSAADIGALAYTQGDNIHFAPGQYDPASSKGQELLGHELTHVVQQRQGRVKPDAQQNKGGFNINADQALEKEADEMGKRVSQGEKISPDLLTRAQSNSIQAKSPSDKVKEFQSQTYYQTNFTPATGRGLFDVGLNPLNGRLVIQLFVNFNFVDGTAADFAGLSGQSKTWTDSEKESWKAKFVKLIEGRWGGKYHFINPNLPGITVYTDVEIEESNTNWHYQLNVTKIPENGFKGSSISHYTDSSGNALGQKNKHYGTLDSEDLKFTDKGAAEKQVGAVHEFGHMIGLGDEYNDGKSGITHAAMVKTALGQTLTEGKNNDIMSAGNSIEKQHYVTFLDALQKLTSDNSWKFKP
ncbi:DUF4157 domain-containing protein [Mangrovivirga sp. M17]|uniref:DUF4157 domain-containing protein n=1 Tax=Mangrovivirga halotolerans TaxID=2993936 RepID=A0ABT3RMH3_9BACT|nr:DUF4157 domain-containing protein [Mangrovivirga halotolerans]MCX2743012.1 DUF4157 domain-containing protein [Mangrovivirga halotolerans]